MIDFKKLLISIKKSCNKGDIKPRLVEVEVENYKTLSYSKIKKVLKDTVDVLNLELIKSIQFNIDGENLMLRLTT